MCDKVRCDECPEEATHLCVSFDGLDYDLCDDCYDSKLESQAETEELPIPDGEECEYCEADASNEIDGLFLCPSCYSDYVDGAIRD